MVAQTEAEPNTADLGAQPPSRRRRRIVRWIILVIVAGLLLSMAVLFGRSGVMMVSGWFTSATSESMLGPRYYVRVEDVLTQLNLADEDIYVNLSFVIEVDDSRLAEELEKVQPEVRDSVLVLLREATPEELEGTAGVYRLREALRYRINRIIEPAQVVDLYFEQIQLQ